MTRIREEEEVGGHVTESVDVSVGMTVVLTVTRSSLTRVTLSATMCDGMSASATTRCSFGVNSKSTRTVPVGVVYDPDTHLRNTSTISTYLLTYLLLPYQHYVIWPINTVHSIAP